MIKKRDDGEMVRERRKKFEKIRKENTHK